jgi:uncharacterized delta-60 repeat protein
VTPRGACAQPPALKSPLPGADHPKVTRSRAAGCGAAILAVAVVASVLATAAAFSAPNEGQLDLSFGSCGFSSVSPLDPSSANYYDFYTSGNAIAVQSDGRFVLAGNRVISRRLADGTPDYTFGTNSLAYAPRIGADLYISEIAVQPDGRLVVAGSKSDYATGANQASYLARYLSSGAIDASFGSGGIVLVPGGPHLNVLAVQGDGTILAGGGQELRRLLGSGTPDPAFGSGGVATLPGLDAADVAVQADGKLVLAVRAGDQERNTYDFGLVRLLADGAADPTFASGQPVVLDVGADYPAGVAVGPDGAIVLAGTSLTVNDGWNKTVLIRRLADGSPDPQFGDGGISVTQLSPQHQDSVNDLVLTSDGRPVVAADVVAPGAQHHASVARFTVRGVLDTTFGTGGQTIVPSEYGPAVSGLAAAPDGGYLIVNASMGGTVARFRGPTAVAGELVTSANCTKRVALTPLPSLDFGLPPGRGTPRAYVVTNTGTAPVQVGRLAWLNQGKFVGIRDTCTPALLAPGSSCQFLVTMDPSRDWPNGTTALTIWHNGEGGWNSAYLFTSPGGMQPAHGMGWNGLGQVGAGPAGGSSMPAYVGLPDAVSVAAGWFHSLALRWDGTVWAWGWNGVGQLGDGTTTDRQTPVQVPGLTDVASVAVGAHSSFAITRAGTVYAWGWNPVGQLGDGTTIDRHRPVRLGGLPPMAQISGGAFHTLGVSADHRAWSWGWNGLGALGDGTTVDRRVPRPVPGEEGIKQVAAGMHHSLSVTLLGAASAWGWNGVGQLGDGTTVDHARPAPVRGLGDHVSFVAAGAHHSLAIRNEGTVAWGWNAVGQLGDGTTVDRPVPVAIPVPAVVPRVTTVAAGVFHSFATMSNGTVWGWGWNGAGQLGLGLTHVQPVAVPTQVSALQAPLVLSGGYAHTVTG